MTPLLAGKVAIVTGSTGGLGPSVVEALLESGAHVAVPTRTEGGLERLHERTGVQVGSHLSGGVVDLADEEGVARYYASVARDHGGIDILVNVAGGFAGGKPVHETPWSVFQEQLDVNFKTAVISCRAAVPHLLARGGGAIVNVASRAAVVASGGLAAYAASKRALLQLTESMADELRARGITVNAILPSVIDTKSNRASMPAADSSSWVDPKEIARVIAFLVGPDARIVSGAAIPVYGRTIG
jgi:NAD(P)-dependent dehydrogenase (short-subunit alcohol dehydrogenase family)